MCSISSITSKKYEIIPKLTDYLSTSAENVLKSTFARIPSYLVEKYRSPKTPVFNRLFGLPASGNCLLYIYIKSFGVRHSDRHPFPYILHCNSAFQLGQRPLLYFKPFLEYFTHIPLCKAGTRKWNGTGRQYNLLFRKSAVLVIIIKMLQFTKQECRNVFHL